MSLRYQVCEYHSSESFVVKARVDTYDMAVHTVRLLQRRDPAQRYMIRILPESDYKRKLGEQPESRVE